MQRLVILTGTAQLNVLVGNVSAYEQSAKDALLRDGWNVQAVRITKQTLFTNQINISIEAYVDNAYTAEQARASATRVLNNVSGVSYAYWDSKLFSNVNLSILSDNIAKTTKTDTTNTDALQNVLNAIGSAALSTAKDTAVAGASNITTPLAIAAVCIVLVLVIKK